MTHKIQLFKPFVNRDEERMITKVFKSNFWASGSGIGYVKQFESLMKKYVGTNNCVAVNSGTAALNLALSVFDLHNKEVILPSLSFVSTAHAITLNGGIPIFADINPQTLCIDPNSIKKLVSKKTKMIIPVHFGGLPADLYEIKRICKENNLHLVEDAAHASGSVYKKKKIGVHGDMVCFSFHPVKNLAMPTGGLITINTKNHKKISTDLKEKRWCGISNRKGTKYDVKNVGWNYYMNEFSAAIGIEQLKKLNRSNKVRQTIAKKYSNKINLEHKMPFVQGCSYHLYWIRVKNRNSFRKRMNDLGIETGIHYQPIHTFSMYHQKNHLPVTDEVGREIVSIPIHPNLSETDVNKIISSINNYA